MESSIVIGIVVSGLFVLGFLDRWRLARRFQAQSAKQRDLEVVLGKFMEESERITLQLSRLISESRGPADPKGTNDSGNARNDQELSRPRASNLERRHLALRLSEKGCTMPEIAERLMIPAGEVELILNLNQSRRGSLRTSA